MRDVRDSPSSLTGPLVASLQLDESELVSVEERGLPHRSTAERAAAELGLRGDVDAVLLGGSVARGEHRSSSDVDLLVVAEYVDLPVRVVVGGVLLERIVHSEAGWVGRLARPRTSWAYAVREAIPLFDQGAGERLRAAADTALTSYRASDTLRSLLATNLWHGQAKVERALDADLMAQGFWASLLVETLIDALYTVHDVPLPAGSRRLEHLAAVPLTGTEQALLQQLLAGSALARLQAAAALAARLRAQLGPADHEASSGAGP